MNKYNLDMVTFLSMRNPFDDSITNFFKQFIENPEWINWMTIISCFFVFFYVIAVMFLFKKENRMIGILMLISLVVAFILNDLILKKAFTRDRPFIALGIEPPGFFIDGYSFPSGHSVTVSAGFFAFLLYFLIIEKGKNKVHIAYSVIFGLIAFGVMLSRIALLHHYFTDCLMGMAEGLIVALIVIFTYKFILYQKAKKEYLQNEHIDEEQSS